MLLGNIYCTEMNKLNDYKFRKCILTCQEKNCDPMYDNSWTFFSFMYYVLMY